MPIQFNQATAGVLTLQAPASGSYTLQLPSGNGTSGQYIVSDGTGGLSWSDLTGLANITTALNTSSPNNTTNISSMTVTGGTTDVFFALTTSVNGGIVQAAVTDSTATGGNARGGFAFDFQLGRSSATQVASGASSSLIGGYGNVTSADYAHISGGKNNTASGIYSYVGGGESNSTATNAAAIVGGYQNTIAASCTGSIILGGRANSVDSEYQTILGGYGGSANGTLAVTVYPTANPLGASTSNALIGAGGVTYTAYDYPGFGCYMTINASTSATTPTPRSASNQINLRTNSVYYVEVYTKEYVGYYPTYSSHYAYCLIKKGANSASTTLVYGAKTVIYQSNFNIQYPTFSADTTYGALSINFYQYSTHVGNSVAGCDFVYLQF